ncbi:MAG: AsnC family transcriptional regulator [Deltaproteobacteria bacterium]|nr:AsnC family transcriptional regulator [Deltaproteobacteria bacterium]
MEEGEKKAGVEKAGKGTVPLSEEDKRLIRLLSLDLGYSAAPYAELAEKTGLTEDRVLERIEELLAAGVIRRMAGVLVHQKSGFSANAMVVWKVERARLDEVGRAMASLSCVSHCYYRPEAPGWPYNLYTMVHALGPEELRGKVESLADLAGGAERRVLNSLRELKKSSLEYFPHAFAGDK